MFVSTHILCSSPTGGLGWPRNITLAAIYESYTILRLGVGKYLLFCLELQIHIAQAPWILQNSPKSWNVFFSPIYIVGSLNLYFLLLITISKELNVYLSTELRKRQKTSASFKCSSLTSFWMFSQPGGKIQIYLFVPPPCACMLLTIHKAVPSFLLTTSHPTSPTLPTLNL